MAVTQRISSGAIIEADSNSGGSEVAGGFVVVGAAATTWGVVGGVRDIQAPIDVEMVDATEQLSGGGMAYIGGFLDFVVTIDVHLDAKETQGAAFWTHHQIWQDAWNGIRRGYRITYSPGTTGAIQLSCLFLADKYVRTRAVGQKIMGTFTLQGCGSAVSSGPIVRTVKS